MKTPRRALFAAAIAFSAVNVDAALSYNQTVFFGDSLTDSGAFAGNSDAGNGTSFTTDPGNVWSENLAASFGTSAIANNPNNPNTDPNGTNYAQGGAQVGTAIGIGTTTSPQSAQPLSTQVSNYLTSVQGSANPQALYTLWGGANDVFFNMAQVSGGLPVNSALTNLGGSAGALAQLAGSLIAAGAGTIIIPTLPDIGTTPSSVLQVVNSAGTGNPNLTDALTAAVTALAQVGTGQVDNALAAAEQALGFPAGSLMPAYQQLASLGTGLSQGYNAALSQALSQVNGNIVLLDSWSLFNEMIANPTEFLLGNTTGVACVTSSALPCTTDTVIDPRTPSVFLFADSVHPTTAGHKIIADYAYSVMNAPALIATLAEVPHGMLSVQQDRVIQHLRNIPQSGSWSLFGGYTLGSQKVEGTQTGKVDATDNHFMIGAGQRMGNGIVLGAALEKATSNVDFSRRQGSFDLDTMTLTLMAGYSSSMLFADLTATLGLQSDYDVRRIIALGGSNRVQTGSTTGDMSAVKLSVGAPLFTQGNLSIGPFGSIARQSVDVKAYSETGSCASTGATCSTTMGFGSQSNDVTLGELGLFANMTINKSKLQAELAFSKAIGQNTRSVSGGLLTTGRDFTLDGIQVDRDSWRFGLSYSAQVSRNASVFAGLQLRNGNDSDTHALNVGVQLDY